MKIENRFKETSRKTPSKQLYRNQNNSLQINKDRDYDHNTLSLDYGSRFDQKHKSSSKFNVLEKEYRSQLDDRSLELTSLPSRFENEYKHLSNSRDTYRINKDSFESTLKRVDLETFSNNASLLNESKNQFE